MYMYTYVCIYMDKYAIYSKLHIYIYYIYTERKFI